MRCWYYEVLVSAACDAPTGLDVGLQEKRVCLGIFFFWESMTYCRVVYPKNTNVFMCPYCDNAFGLQAVHIRGRYMCPDIYQSLENTLTLVPVEERISQRSCYELTPWPWLLLTGKMHQNPSVALQYFSNSVVHEKALVLLVYASTSSAVSH